MPLTSSITSQGCGSWSTMWWMVTTFEWLSRASARASRSTRSRMASDVAASARTALRATSRCRTLSRARHTVPIPPLPSRSISSNRPSITSPGAFMGDRLKERREG